MANLSYIDIEKSIETGRLVSKKDWLAILDRIVFSFLLIAFVTYPSLIYFQADIQNSNEKIIGYIIFPIIIVFGLYSLYRKAFENSLTSVDTVLGRHKTKKLLLEFLNDKGYDNFRQSTDIVIVNIEENLSFNNLWTKTITFIITDNKIYFNIVKNYPRLNPPVLFAHLFLKADIIKFFKDKNN